MKILIKFIGICLLSITLNVKGQFIDNAEIYNKGISYLFQKKYQLADSCFSIFINKNPAYPIQNFIPFRDVYYNKGLAKLGMKDTCSFCELVYTASVFNDNESLKAFYKICSRNIDSTFLSSKYLPCSKKNSKYLLISYYDKFLKYRHGRVLYSIDESIKESNIISKNLIGLFRVENRDTIFYFLDDAIFMYENNVCNLPNLKKWNKPYLKIIESNLNYPENKELARKKYSLDTLFIYCNVTADENKNIQNIRLVKSYPMNIDDLYKNEAFNVIKKTSKYIENKYVFGKKVKFETLYLIPFILK
jgi:hypothetical protein